MTGVIPLAIRSSDFLDTINRERLSVLNLKRGRYLLAIDGSTAGVFTQDELTAGVNLAAYPTPMAKQARDVLYLTLKRAGVYHFRWQFLQISLADNALREQPAAVREMNLLEKELAAQQRARAQPVPHRYTLALAEVAQTR
jgi:hypothetical protein